VTDLTYDRVQKYDASGTFLQYWGGYGSGDGQFINPEGIAFDPAGTVSVADTGNHRIQQFTANGTFIRQWACVGSENGQLQDPGDVAVDSAGNVYAACVQFQKTGWPTIQFGIQDTASPPQLIRSVVRKFTPAGTFITQWGGLGSGDGQFREVQGIAVDSAGNVYVADTDNHRVQTFIPVITPVPPSGNAPRDLAGDGLSEDINGNGVRDFNDVVLFFNQMDWIAANEPVGTFDFNKNGQIDFNDIVRLFNGL